MGSAIAGLATRAEQEVQIITPHRDEAEEVARKYGAIPGKVGDDLTGEIVVLAVPHAAIAELIDTYGPRWGGQIIVDITNPVASSAEELEVPAGTSSAEQIAEKVPEARVLKAFNTTFAATVVSGEVGDQPTTVLVAGDDDNAKKALIALVTQAGLRAVDVGPLKRARELEALGFLEVSLASQGLIDWTGGFALVGQPE